MTQITPEEIRRLAKSYAKEQVEKIFTCFPELRQEYVKGFYRAVEAEPPTASASPKPHKLHWTQRPEMKAKLMRMARKARRTRMAREHGLRQEM